MVKNFLYRVFCGFFLGVSIFAPGFSGSVVAIIMGIYQDMLRIVSNPFKRLKENIIFCIPLGIGALISGVLFIISFNYLFETYEKATYLLFVGLITGNLPVIYKEIKDSGFKRRYHFGGIAAFAAALALGLLSVEAGPRPDAVAISGLPTMGLGGFAGGVTAFIPGMSVSMVLIIIGVYNQVISIAYALLNFNFAHLAHFCVFGVCAVAGIVIASRGIKAVFDKIPGLANTMVFGFMAGSLIGVLVRSLQIEDAGFNWLLGGIMLAAGLIVSMLFVVMGRHMKKT